MDQPDSKSRESTEGTGQKLLQALPFLIAAAVILFHGIAGTIWVASNEIIQGSDEVDYIHSAQRFERYWPSDWSSPISALKSITNYPAYAPAAPLSLILAKVSGDLFGKSLATMRMTSLVAYLITMVLLFLLGRKLVGPWGGLLAVVLFVCFPYGFIQSRFFNGFALNSLLITATIALLFYSKNLTRWSVMAAFGIVMGLAFLAERGTPALVLIGPLLVYGIIAQINHLRSRPVMAALAIAFTLVAAGLALLIAGRYVLAYAMTSASHNQEMMTVPYYPNRMDFSYYLHKIVRWVTGEPFALLIVLASLWTLLIKSTGRKILGLVVLCFVTLKVFSVPMYSVNPWLVMALVLAAFLVHRIEQGAAIVTWIAVPLLVFSTFATKDLEYIYSLLPAFALVGAVVLVRISESNKVRLGLGIAVGSLFMIYTLQFMAVSFPQGAFRQTYLSLPDTFRFANGHESYGSVSSLRKEQAKQVLTILDHPKQGALIYFPTEWDADTEGEKPSEYDSGSQQWMTELQVQIDFLHGGLDHFVFSPKTREGKAWAGRFRDALFWLPMSEKELRDFRRQIGLDNYAYIFSALSPEMEKELFEIFPPIEGKKIGDMELYPGCVVEIRELSKTSKVPAEPAN